MNYKDQVRRAVSRFLKREMLEQEMTAKWLAYKMTEVCGVTVSQSAIYTWQRGEVMPGADKILAMAEIFEASTDEILGAYDEDVE